jgi:hypothetical protein
MNTNGQGWSRAEKRNCTHWPPCPDADAPDASAAHVISDHLEQGWELLCNGIVLFDDQGALLPDGRTLGSQVMASPRQHRDSAVAVPA